MRFKRFSDKSLRRPYWDYRRDGAYFITICTKNRVRYFGEVIEGKKINDARNSTNSNDAFIQDSFDISIENITLQILADLKRM